MALKSRRFSRRGKVDGVTLSRALGIKARGEESKRGMEREKERGGEREQLHACVCMYIIFFFYFFVLFLGFFPFSCDYFRDFRDFVVSACFFLLTKFSVRGLLRACVCFVVFKKESPFFLLCLSLGFLLLLRKERSRCTKCGGGGKAGGVTMLGREGERLVDRAGACARCARQALCV